MHFHTQADPEMVFQTGERKGNGRQRNKGGDADDEIESFHGRGPCMDAGDFSRLPGGAIAARWAAKCWRFEAKARKANKAKKGYWPC